MKTIALTGGIGSGKTVVARFFEVLDIPVYYADIEAKKLYDNAVFVEKLYKTFGKSIFDSEGKPDKKAIAALVFNNQEALKDLNALIHPLVKQDFEQWVRKQNPKSKYIIQENAIIFEAGFEKLFDKIICVYAPLPMAIERAMKRDNATKEMIENRLKNQMDIDERLKKSDYVIYTDEKQALLPQILTIHNQLLVL